jgi:hypothetical protein
VRGSHTYMNEASLAQLMRMHVSVSLREVGLYCVRPQIKRSADGFVLALRTEQRAVRKIGGDILQQLGKVCVS